MPNFILHKFRPSETIDAVIRLKGRHNYTPEDLVILRSKFNELNGLVVPHPGDTFKIPLLEFEPDPVPEVVEEVWWPEAEPEPEVPPIPDVLEL
jgi:hypothetical protein